MFNKPTIADFQRNLDERIHESEHTARAIRGKQINSHTARGLGISGAVASAVVSDLDGLHKETVKDITKLANGFILAGIPIADVITNVQSRLSNFSGMLFGQVPTSALPPHGLEQFRQQWSAVWNQRTEGAVKNIQIGMVNGGSTPMINKVSTPMTDQNMQVVVLQKFYDQRHERSFVSLPVEPGTSKQEQIRVSNICDQLRQKGLIEWKTPMIGEPEGMGHITAKGIDLIENGTMHIPDKPIRRTGDKFEILDSPLEQQNDLNNTIGPLGVACIFLDLDDFKKLNGKYTNRTVDEHILIPLQKIVKDTLGTKGFPYQEGGDEISILLPNMTEGMAVEFAKALRLLIKAESFVVKEDNGVKVNVSIGVAHVSADAPREQLFQHANEAEQHAKSTGKDRICIYRPDGCINLS